MGVIKNAFFASCSSSSSSSAHVAVELDSIFASGKRIEKVDLIVHGKMTFLFTTEYVKIKLQLYKFNANVILLMIFIVDHPV